MKTFYSRILGLYLLVFACSGTVYAKGPVYSGVQNQTVSLTSEPAGAKVYLNGQLICASTPAVVTIPCSGAITPDKKNMPAAIKRAQYESRVQLVFKLDGYQDGEEMLLPKISPLKGNKFQFVWPAAAVHMFKRDPKVQRIYDQDPTIVSGEARNRVSRDKPGQSALEQTVIRWYFDSDPRGARVFWRVISSVPAEVKNTNETYLMTTPFEETRSFDILGLTYENSRNVQIEIKVSKKGYEDQIKRFNVRQAIDQQEISGFFELVAKEQPAQAAPSQYQQPMPQQYPQQYPQQPQYQQQVPPQQYPQQYPPQYPQQPQQYQQPYQQYPQQPQYR
ncbi:PEGA domain-containing protein [uncultured Alistipes sp.]|uniref:PEGA domain-containing protein n=1 Tax=uncultured Alistipes sp. TaxID=538949 RepID=UPI0027315C90|nr:PEGA domain-containing protein [uncultured Alistipes sp.]